MKYKAEYKPSELLCPSKNVWVDFEVAKERLEARSPVRHCCNISASDEDFCLEIVQNTNKEARGDEHDDSDMMGDRHEEQKNNHSTSSVLQSCSTPDSAATQIKFYIHPGNVLTLECLNGEGQAIVRPMFEDFAREIGEEICQKCLIKLC